MRQEKMDAQWEKNRKFFTQHEKEFEEKYPGLYVAVHDGKILGTGKEAGPLVGRLYDEYGYIPLYASLPGRKEIEYVNFPIVI